MKIESIKAHLKPYSIYEKRRTTINHAFASAIAPNDNYDPKILDKSMMLLEQDPSDLKCVYCGEDAETWDHVVGLVKNNEFSGFGHVVGNLVPCCKMCNQRKGNKNWKIFFATHDIMNRPGSGPRKERLEKYIRKYSHPIQNYLSGSQDEMKELRVVRDNVFKLLKRADRIAKKIRGKLTA